MKRRFERLCMPNSVYALFLYLMSCNDEDIDNTFFLFGSVVPASISSRFKNAFTFNDKEHHRKRRLLSRQSFIEVFYWRFIKWFILPPMKNMRVFASDTHKYHTYMIGKKQYTLLEQAPHSTFMETKNQYQRNRTRREMKHYGLLKALYGPVYGHSQGRNGQCTDIMLWKYDAEYDDEFTRGKNVILVDLEKEWQNCSPEKRSFIFEMFDVSDTDISELKKRSVVLLTQPLYNRIDSYRHAIIYWSMAHHYPKDKLLIKVHPRDHFAYEKILPGYKIFRKPIPFQLLDLIGVRWEKAVTMFSTAVMDFVYPIEVDWYGQSCGSFLPDLWKQAPIPPNVNVCDLGFNNFN